MLQFSGVIGHRAAAVGLHVCVNAAVAKDKPGRRQDGGVGAEAATQRAGPVAVSGCCRRVLAALVLLVQVERGRGGGRGREGLDGVLVVRGVPPLQELQEEDAQGEGGGERHGRTPGCLGHQLPRPPPEAANTGSRGRWNRYATKCDKTKHNTTYVFVKKKENKAWMALYLPAAGVPGLAAFSSMSRTSPAESRASLILASHSRGLWVFAAPNTKSS